MSNIIIFVNKNETVKTHRELKNLLKNVYDCAWTVFGSFFFFYFFFSSLVSVECEIFLYTLCVNALGRVKRSDELKLIRLPMIWDPKPISVYKRNVHLMMSSATWKTKHTHTSFFYLMSCFRSVCLPLICLFDLYICVPFDWHEIFVTPFWLYHSARGSTLTIVIQHK